MLRWLSFQTVHGVLYVLAVPWTARRSNQPVLKEISPEYSLKGLMLKLTLPTLWLPDGKNWLLGKDPDAGKDWRQEEKGMTEDEMVGRYHQLDGREFEQAPGVGVGQGSLACYHPWGHKESTWLNDWTELRWLPGLCPLLGTSCPPGRVPAHE